jgi:hypothetical protein
VIVVIKSKTHETEQAAAAQQAAQRAAEQAADRAAKETAPAVQPPPIQQNNRSATPPAAESSPSLSAGAMMIGPVDVSHFAGIRPGDTPAQVAAHFGRPMADEGSRKTYLNWLTVDYENGGAKAVHLMYRGWNVVYARLGHVNDDVMLLLSYDQARAVERLGDPQQRDSGDDGPMLSWSFADGRSEPGWLQLKFGPGDTSVVDMISVTW